MLKLVIKLPQQNLKREKLHSIYREKVILVEIDTCYKNRLIKEKQVLLMCIIHVHEKPWENE